MRRASTRSAKWAWPSSAAFSARSFRIWRTISVLSKGGRLPTSTAPAGDGAAEALVFRIRHHRLLRGHVQGKTPRRTSCRAVAFFLSTGAGGGDGTGRQTAQPRFVFDDELPGIGGIEDVFRIARSQARELALEDFEPGTLVGREVSAGLLKIGDRLVDETAVDAGERRGLGRGSEGFEAQPERRIERYPGVKRGDCREQVVVRIAQRGGIGDRLQVGDLAPCLTELLGGVFKREKGVGVCQRLQIACGDGINRRLSPSQHFCDGGSDQLGPQLGPADFKSRIEERRHTGRD